MKILGIGCIMILIAAAPGAAAADAKDWSEFTHCDKTPIYTAHPLSGDFPKDKLIERLHPDPLVKSTMVVERVCGIATAKWPNPGGADIVALETQNFVPSGFSGAAQRDGELRLALVKHEDPSVILAQLSAPLEIENDCEFAGFDSEAYKLDAEQLALGVRMDCRTMYAGGGGRNVSLHLVRRQGSALQIIFSTLMESSAFVQQAERSGGKAKLETLNTATKGYFDIRKLAKRGKLSRSAIAKWNGKSYSLSGRDPVKNINADSN